MTLNKDDPEPLRYYDWIGWKLRQEEQKKKLIQGYATFLLDNK